MSLVDRTTVVADSLARLRGDELYQYLPAAIEELADLHRDYAQAFCEDQAEDAAAPASAAGPQLVDKGPFPFRYTPSADPRADGLYECLIRDERWEVDGVPLSPDQVNAAMSVLASRTDITIFTGPAGAGKTFVIRWLVSVGLMQICAMTARAAVPYGAVTVDALFCINRESGAVWSEDLLARNMERSPSIIGIDEGAMLGDNFGRAVRKAAKKFNKRLVLIGDWAQARPVKDEWITEGNLLDGANIIRLEQVLRQDNPEYVQVLNKLRLGEVSEEINTYMQQFVEPSPPPGSGWIRMYATNKKADAYNNARYQSHLRSPEVNQVKAWFFTEFTDMRRSGGKPRDAKFIATQVDTSGFADKMSLAVGTQVLLTRNETGNYSYVNGDVGEILDFVISTPTHNAVRAYKDLDQEEVACLMQQTSDNMSGTKILGVLVRLDRTGRTVVVGQHQHEVKDPAGNPLHSLTGFPIRLGYAVTIHKCQGMTVERAWVDVGSIAAMPHESRHGLLYVAASRTRTPGGLRISSWEPKLVMSDKAVRHLL